MATRDQERAQLAWKHVNAVREQCPDQDSPKRKRYGATVHGLPALIRNAGLSQALHFVLSRNKEEVRWVLEHLADQLKRVDGSIRDADTLLKSVREAELGRYLRLTQEALSAVNWYKRFVQGVLKVEAGEQDEED